MLIILLVTEHFDWKINRQDGTSIPDLCDIIYSCHVLKHNAVLFVCLFVYLFIHFIKLLSLSE